MGEHEGKCDLNKLFETLAGIFERRENNEVKVTFTLTQKEESAA